MGRRKPKPPWCVVHDKPRNMPNIYNSPWCPECYAEFLREEGPKSLAAHMADNDPPLAPNSYAADGWYVERLERAYRAKG